MSALAPVNAQFDAEFGQRLARIPTPRTVKPLTAAEVSAMDRYDAGVSAYVAENLQARIARDWNDDECVENAWDALVCPKPTRGWRQIVAALRAGDTAEAGRMLHAELYVGVVTRAEDCLRDEFVP